MLSTYSSPGGQWLPFRGCDVIPSLSHPLHTPSFPSYPEVLSSNPEILKHWGLGSGLFSMEPYCTRRGWGKKYSMMVTHMSSRWMRCFSSTVSPVVTRSNRSESQIRFSMKSHFKTNRVKTTGSLGDFWGDPISRSQRNRTGDS